MTPLSRTPDQVLRVATRVGGAFLDPDVAPTVTAVLVNGQARNIAVSRVRLTGGGVLAGHYAFMFDGSSLAVGDVVEILFRSRAAGRPLDACVGGRVCAGPGYGVPSLVPSGPILPPPSGGDGPLFDASSRVAFVGNSYTQQFDIPGAMAHYVGTRLPAATIALGPPPHLGTTIANGDDGYFPGMSLGGMALFPTIDQRDPGNTGSTDAIDALASQPPGSVDWVVLTSGFTTNQEQTGVGGIEAETVGSGIAVVVLEVKRRVVAEIASRLGPFTGVVIRMTHEGYRLNTDVGLAQYNHFIRRQVLAARALESEGIVAAVVPDGYVYSRLTAGAFGPVGSGLTSPVPAYADLTHSTSTQPDGRNYGFLNRTQGVAAPFGWNGHQNAIAAIVSAWTWGYAMWGIDPRGDTTFQSPAGLPEPLNAFVSADGRIYGGHRTGVGTAPYDLAVNPGGPPDGEFDLDWSPTTQQQIQDRVVAAVDDYVAGTTEFD